MGLSRLSVGLLLSGKNGSEIPLRGKVGRVIQESTRDGNHPGSRHARLPPNPKIRLANPMEPAFCPRFVANFSIPFANWGTESLGENERNILDPFSGSATSLLLASSKDFNSVGIEMNPAWVLYGRARLAVMDGTLEKEVNSLMSRCLSCDGFVRDEVAAGLFTEILQSRHVGELSARDVLAASILASARARFRPEYGMNHSWPQYNVKRVKIPKSTVAGMVKGALRHAKWVQQNFRPQSESQLILGDARRADVYGKGFSMVLTSPPYLSRLDYVMASKPELDYMRQIGMAYDVDAVRREQIGTVVVSETGRNERPLPDSSNKIVQTVASHTSKGSRSYYSKFFSGYLCSMNDAFSSITAACAPEARWIMVVQDSWYKDVHIPTNSLLADMLREHGWKLESEWRYRVKTLLSSLNPYSRAWKSNRVVNEYVQEFVRDDDAS